MALFGRKKKSARATGMSPLRAGIIGLAVVILISFVGFTKLQMLSSPFELKAIVHSANNLQPKSPVRIAGVNVGLVESVSERSDGSAKVVMQIQPQGLPIHSDAQMKIRPRIFLEGNFFVDLSPGSPSAPTVKSGYTMPIQNTATPVQFDQLIGVLTSNTRQNLQTLLKEYAEKGLGNGGAQAYNKGLDSSPGAELYSSIVNQALLGKQPHDLQTLLRGQQRLFRSLSTNPQALEDLITQLNVTANAFARQDVALQQTVPALDDTLRVATPALVSLNNALPELRRFARVALPGTISSGPTIDASLPELNQLRLLVRPQELEGLVRDLRPTIPALAHVNQSSIPLFAENRTLSACQNNVLVPAVKTPIPDPDFPNNTNQPFYKQASRGLVGLSGESRISDANTPYFHAQFGSGATTVVLTDRGQSYFATAPAPPEGVRPARPDHRPVFRPGIPCELQVVPDMNAPGGPGQQSVTETIPGGLLPPLPTPFTRWVAKAGAAELNEEKFYLTRTQVGKTAVDPMSTTPREYVAKMKQLGFGVQADGKVYTLGAKR